ncbi:cell division protein ZapE [Alsobacter metallidurans]|uniref:Cell division protein ZapE n=1 Tax=Alsobacter metallidurans TaxID=340221 RepID=A0A917IB43_9HYPH|nr:cell division protein ZapE [Alsobacter metallidurans]GGH31217.1 cell division protein ZapE [Alsobacter metallidurans]
MSATLAERYAALLSSGVIEADGAQKAVVAKLDRLAAALAERHLARKSSALGWLFGKASSAEPLRGLYVWGSVGRGKTMLMDLFYEVAPVRAKRRAHFLSFMADVHERIHAFRQRVKRGEVKDGDPIPPVAASIAAEASLLCFDEFTVTDIADAMILGRLFTALFAEGVTVVATSNVEPDRLYEGGLNRALFLPFIGLLQERMEVVRLDARTDYRLEKLAGAEVWHVPADDESRRWLDRTFASLSGVPKAGGMRLTVKGHPLEVPAAAHGVARFGFEDLCAKPLGGADYLAIAERFHTVLIDGVPVMGIEQRNEAKRFIMLVDALYDSSVKLVASAQAPAQELYTAREGREAFEFDRTVSRLIEMRSEQYLAAPHGRGDRNVSGNTTGLVET